MTQHNVLLAKTGQAMDWLKMAELQEHVLFEKDAIGTVAVV